MTRKRVRRIFVSYQYTRIDKGNIVSGFGNNTGFSTNRNLLSNKEIRKLEKEIAKENGFKNVVILNYQLMN
ncbi:hypothetical protein HXA31_20595 [Salipaludibacillus agaradhaerens]|jgi:hypothetical protein|uniref:Uncharacterized protein n=1 Tax=Salipaludibacillus agaradhaerens TaxID=76935 RepID=A0A9Q4FZK3_SALAG|nr:hypothetical protein [Salipaludibacillus agaradhaerens]MCR6096888.1 hypothetical protein [Salipaludibacillus agaradhaerens]MCR6116732.1 hypothetical protein [Salipaludibacillus agaradhaerens]